MARAPLPVGAGPCAFLQQAQPSAALEMMQVGWNLIHNNFRYFNCKKSCSQGFLQTRAVHVLPSATCVSRNQIVSILPLSASLDLRSITPCILMSIQSRGGSLCMIQQLSDSERLSNVLLEVNNASWSCGLTNNVKQYSLQLQTSVPESIKVAQHS